MAISLGKIADDQEYPWIKPTDFVLGLARRRRLDLILPKPTIQESRPVLAEYWKRYRLQFPDFALFRTLTDEQLEMTLPCKIHGDEGRSCLNNF